MFATWGRIDMAYTGFIVRLKNIRQHSNADRLQAAECFGNSVIVGMDAKEGDMGVYFPVDGKLGIEYATKNNLIRIKNEDGSNSGGYLDPEKRNITALKLRGEKSDGLFMPLNSLNGFTNTALLKEGDLISVLNGVVICEKYIPKRNPARQNPISTKKGKKPVPKADYPLFEQHIDTSQLAYNMHSFKVGDICNITLKMHGTSGRSSFTLKEDAVKQPKIVRWFYEKLNVKIPLIKTWDYVSGTRRVVLDDFTSGYYGNDAFRKTWHDFFVGKLRKGETVYYEIVGWVNDTTSIMPSCSNSKTKDKEFIKQYGATTEFTYGCEQGKNDMYIYRMTMTNEDGDVVEYPYSLIQQRAEQMGAKVVPELDRFIFITQEDLKQRVSMFEDGVDPIGRTHVREGIVVRIENREKFTAFKSKNWFFKVLESIIKTEAVEADIEEAQGE